jgi:hypothetical protein
MDPAITRTANMLTVLQLQARLHDIRTNGEFYPGQIAHLEAALSVRREMDKYLESTR